MKIILDSKDKLVLQDKPWWILLIPVILCAAFGYGVWIGAVPNETFPWPILLLPPIVFLISAFYFERIHATFDLTQNRLSLTRQRLLHATKSEYDLNALRDVKLDGMADSDGGTFRIMLHFKDQPKPVPLTFYESNETGTVEIQKRIQQLLAQRNH